MSGSGSGSLVAGTTYEYMLTWVSSGVETGPSQTLSATVAPGDDNIVFTGLPVINPPAGQPDYGANKVLYRRRQPLSVNEAPGRLVSS